MKTTLAWLAFGALIISNAVFAMLYFTGDEAPADTARSSEVGEVAGESKQVMMSEASAEAAAEQVQDRTSYTAEAAPFSLDLDSTYQVVVEKDGGADSERATQLKIGRKNTDEFGSVSLRADDYVKVEAYPSDFNGTRDQFITNDTALQGNFADESSSSVDGIQARRFELEGVGSTIKYYFEREGITFFIEAWDVSSGDTQVMLDDVVRGFSFN